jgi:hypothetical protein
MLSAIGTRSRSDRLETPHTAGASAEIREVETSDYATSETAPPLAERGETSIGGDPVHPSGGLESKGHPTAATGLGQIYELVSQLRGERDQGQVDGARVPIQGTAAAPSASTPPSPSCPVNHKEVLPADLPEGRRRHRSCQRHRRTAIQRYLTQPLP